MRARMHGTARAGTLCLPACAAVGPGLVKLLDRDEDLLAAVLGHEVAHALARHSTEKMTCAEPQYPISCVDKRLAAKSG